MRNKIQRAAMRGFTVGFQRPDGIVRQPYVQFCLEILKKEFARHERAKKSVRQKLEAVFSGHGVLSWGEINGLLGKLGSGMGLYFVPNFVMGGKESAWQQVLCHTE